MTVDAKIYASLHAHSTHSDGVYSPEELAQVGFDQGYQALVLTDHDTVTGDAEMMEACRKMGFRISRNGEVKKRHSVAVCLFGGA